MPYSKSYPRFDLSIHTTRSHNFAGASATVTWTIEVGVDGEGGAIYVSPIFSVGRFDFRLVAAAAKESDLSLYLEHFPSSSLAAMPSIKCRLRWSQVSEGEMVFEHAFDDPLASSMLVGKAGLIPLAGVDADVRVEATVTLDGVHFPSRTEQAELEAAAWEQMLREMETLRSDAVGNGCNEGAKRTGEELETESVWLFGSSEEGN